MKHLTTIAGLAAVLAVPAESQADPFSVRLLDTRHTTSVFVQNTELSNDPATVATASRTQTNTGPLSDSLQLADCFSDACAERLAAGQRPLYSSADADTFSVTAFTSALDHSARATALAETVLEFAAVDDGTASLGLFFGGWDLAWFSSGMVQLFDLTSNSQLWNFEWTRNLDGSVPWTIADDDSAYRFQAVLPLDQAFLADHRYALTMRTRTHGATDSEGTTIQVSGLATSVPEPASVLLLITGLASGALARRRRHRCER